MNILSKSSYFSSWKITTI